MKYNWSHFFTKNSLQLLLFLTINSLFILKYTPRYGMNPYLILTIYGIVFFTIYFTYQKHISKCTEKSFKSFYWILLALALVAITGLLISINPYSIRVDRWSALTFFWDSIFNGHYPYTTHTHISTTNFASPFPLWHLINLPFYILGDVGIGIIVFLILISITVKYYFSSYRQSFFYLLLLLISPAYWWEVSARSDSLSNGLFVFMIILWFIKNNRNLSNSFFLAILACGIISSTRLTALIPLALFFFQPYLKLTTKLKVIFPISILSITLISFLPFIFWDTKTWIFFSRNPFISQTGNGNIYVLLIMLILGVIMALSWKNTIQFFNITSIFIFIFILTSQVVRILKANEGNLFSDCISDISYFNLALPYCLGLLTSKIKLT